MRGRARLQSDLTDSVMIAWDESPECCHAVSAASSQLLAHPVDHGWAGIQGRDDAAFTPTLGARTGAAWPCAQSVGVVAG